VRLRLRQPVRGRTTSRSRRWRSATCASCTRRPRASATSAARSTTALARQCGDVAFFRAYVGKDGLPADYAADNVRISAAFLKLASTPLEEGDLVMVTGYPGHTSLLAPSRDEAIQSSITRAAASSTPTSA